MSANQLKGKNMSDITKDQVIDWLSNQTVLEVADLVKELEEKWGVSAAAPVAVAAAAMVLLLVEAMLLLKKKTSLMSS